MTSTTSHMDASCTKFDEEENIERFQPKGFYRKELAGQQLLSVVTEKCAPVEAAPALWCGKMPARLRIFLIID
jgi:hypothetical protein